MLSAGLLEWDSPPSKTPLCENNRKTAMDNQYATTAVGLGVGTPAQSAYRNDSKVLVPISRRCESGLLAIADAFRHKGYSYNSSGRTTLHSGSPIWLAYITDAINPALTLTFIRMQYLLGLVLAKAWHFEFILGFEVQYQANRVML